MSVDLEQIIDELKAPPGPRPRRRGYLLRDRSSWPVAIVVQAGEGVPLEAGTASPAPQDPALSKEELKLQDLMGRFFAHLEGHFVAQELERAGYDVHHLKSGQYRELRDLLRNQDVVERLVVFHYCGHANRRFVALRDEAGQPVAITAQGLSEQLGAYDNALKLIYMNGCLTEAQDAAFRATFKDVAFIGNKLEVPADFALHVATTIYRRLATLEPNGDDAGTARTRLGDAWLGTRGEFNAERDGLIHEAVHADIRDGGFCLAEGQALIADKVIAARSSRNPSLLTVYALVVSILAAAFACLAHVYPETSSPAFQAAFSLVPDIDHERAINALHVSDFEAPPNDPCSDQGLVAGSANKTNGCDKLLGHPWPAYGFYVESARTALIALLMFIFATICYRWRPKGDPRLASSSWKRWFSKPENYGLTALGIAVGATVIWYHTLYAPGTLGEMNTDPSGPWYAARWSLFHATERLFEDYPKPSDLLAIEALRQTDWATLLSCDWATLLHLADTTRAPDAALPAPAQGCPDPVVTDALRADAADLQERLYADPYWYYMFYALIVFIALAIPCMKILSLGILMDADMAELRLSALRVSIRQAADLAKGQAAGRGDPEVIEGKYQRELGEIRDSLSRFAGAFALFVGFVVFEILIGRTTTSALAMVFTLLALFVIALALFRVPRLWRIFGDQRKRLVSLLQELHDASKGNGGTEYAEALRRIDQSPAALLRGTSRAIIAGSVLTLLAIVVLGLADVDWIDIGRALGIG